MIRLSPAIRISIGLVLLTVSLLLVGDLIGLVPDRSDTVLAARKNLAESLVLQFSAAAERGDIPLIRKNMQYLVDRDSDIQSAALRTTDGQLITLAGNHLAHWKPPANGLSSPTHVLVPIFKGKDRWATAEIRFAPLWGDDFFSGFKNSFYGLILFIMVAGFAGYFFMIKRTLRELDPAAVIPARVQSAFDVLKEGVLILDEKEQVVLANKSFAGKIGKTTTDLIGFKGSELGWKDCTSERDKSQLPWIRALREGRIQSGIPLTLARKKSTDLSFMVNAAPILDGKGKNRGVLATFDDVTELEDKNQQLNGIVTKLKKSTKKIKSKNRELEFLANHDPMTLLLNRRAFNTYFEKLFTFAQHENRELSCIMADIDHFKAVNDTYGHATGDKVIKAVAATLKESSRTSDLVGRLGGEEFCLVLPGLTIKQAAEVAERIRLAIKKDDSTGIHITSSLGVSSIKLNASDHEDLTNQADKALYVAKESGRNRVICWGADDIDSFSVKVEKTDEPSNKESDDKTTDSISTDQDQKSEVQRLRERIRELESTAQKNSLALQHSSLHDSVTGLATRTLFHDRIMQAMSRGRRYDNIVAVLSMSCETIQRVNDTFGQSAGNDLIRGISRRLAVILRSIDTVATFESSVTNTALSRLGQEEYGILLTDLDQAGAVTWIVKRIFDSFKVAFVIEGNDIYISANIGISLYPYDGDTAEILLNNAATAKNHAKSRLGKNRFYFYSNDLNKTAIKQIEIESLLHQALKNDEFSLYYQPKIAAATGQIQGMEALIRWASPKLGLVMPNTFIPLAEHSGMIEEIGEWVLETACRQVRTWLDKGYEQCAVAINFSAKQFRQVDLPEKIGQALKHHHLDPKYLEIEVTESDMMDDITTAITSMQAIHKMGITIAIDDFGTGYSSLSYVKSLPVSQIKIDRSFVADITKDQHDANIVASIISMVHSLGMKVVAEGVEEEAQVAFLKKCGCDLLQGYLFSRPAPAEKATELLKKQIEKNK